MAAPIKRIAAKTTPVNRPMCNPEIASKWARFAARKSSSTSRGIWARSPVMMAVAKAPSRGAMFDVIADDTRARSPAQNGAPAPGAPMTKGVRL